MNGRHLGAFLWLRWRLRINQLKRGGIANVVVLVILAVGAVLLAAALFFGMFALGLLALPQAPPAVVLYVWDGLVVAFLFFWIIGLLADVQRSEALSLEKFLYLPVSPAGAFLVNYVSSLLSFNLIVFLPAMVALGLALVFAKGPAMLVVLPLLAAFLLAVTALTYQFQGWLASLMANPRRRRTVIVLMTAGFILACQLPNLLNVAQPWKSQKRDEAAARQTAELNELKGAFESGQVTPAQYDQRLDQIKRAYAARTAEASRRSLDQLEHAAQLVNLVLPPGWLPLGAEAAAAGNVLPAALGTLGLTLIGAGSLWRSYRTTLRLYTGQFNLGKRLAAVAHPMTAGKRPANLLEKDLPWISEQAAAIALAGFRSLLRAPEAKMMLLTPLFLVLVFGSLLLTHSVNLPEQLRPLLAFGATSMILLSMGQLVGNQFGFDRSGFRVFVLCAARRKDVLLGKNLSFAPLLFGMAALVVAVLQVVYPMRIDYFLATMPQLISMFLLFCLLANLLSIFAPMPIAPGTLKPSHARVIPMLLHLVFVFLFPLALAPTLLPLGAEFALEGLGWVHGVPICLALSVVECVAVVYVYRLVLTWQGDLLQAREQQILQTVTTRD